MAHPYHHSVSSSKDLEGVGWEDHFPLHDWLDSSKFGFADARHRSLLHNPAGVWMSCLIFKDIKNAKKLASQHIIEDMGEVYPITKWLPIEYWNWKVKPSHPLSPSPSISKSDVKGSLIFNNPFPSKISSQISTGLDLLLSVDETESLEKDDPRRFFFFSSAGPYLCERLLGPTLNPNQLPYKDGDKLLATRSVFEYFIQKVWGFIPSHQDLMAQRPIEDWMWKKARPLSKELKS